MALVSFPASPQSADADGLRGERRLRDEIVDLVAEIDEMTAAFRKRLDDVVGGCSLREQSTLLQGVHRARSTIETAAAGVVAQCDRDGWVGLDGHGCVRSWVAAICHTTADASHSPSPQRLGETARCDDPVGPRALLGLRRGVRGAVAP